jgi:hypothetical protein
LDSLRIHCQKKHDIPTIELYAALFLSDGKKPTCACVRGETPKFWTLQKGIDTLGETGDDFDRKTCFVDWVMWYHTTNDVSGIVLCEKCHTDEHKKLHF